MLLIRPATADDIAAADEVARLAFAEMRHIYRPKDDFVIRVCAFSVRLVAEIDGSIVGTVSYAANEDRLHLRRLAVDAAFRRRGIARALAERLSDLAQKAELRALSLYTIRQTGNVPMFERLGFIVVGEEPADWVVSVCGEELSEVFMEKGALRV